MFERKRKRVRLSDHAADFSFSDGDEVSCLFLFLSSAQHERKNNNGRARRRADEIMQTGRRDEVRCETERMLISKNDNDLQVCYSLLSDTSFLRGSAVKKERMLLPVLRMMGGNRE